MSKSTRDHQSDFPALPPRSETNTEWETDDGDSYRFLWGDRTIRPTDTAVAVVWCARQHADGRIEEPSVLIDRVLDDGRFQDCLSVTAAGALNLAVALTQAVIELGGWSR